MSEDNKNCNGREAIRKRMEQLHVELPDNPPSPAGSYIPVVRTANLLYVSGQIPIGSDQKVAFTGKVSDDNMEDGIKSARMCALNILSQVNKELGGDLGKVTRIVRISGFVNSEPGFSQQPTVINGASDLLFDVFGKQVGQHSRIAVGVAGLPLDSMTEIDAIIEIKQ